MSRNASRNPSENNFERFKSIEKSAASKKGSINEFDKNSKISPNKSLSNNRYAENFEMGNIINNNNNGNDYNEKENNESNNKEINFDQNSGNNINSDNYSRLSEKKREFEKENFGNLNKNEAGGYKEKYNEFDMEAKKESGNSRFYVNEEENKIGDENNKEKSPNNSNYNEELFNIS